MTHPKAPSRIGFLRLIGAFKLFKAALLIAVAVGLFRLLNPDRAERARQWINALAWNYDSPAVHRVLSVLSGLNPGRLQALGVGALAYSTLFTVEGVGLWSARRWAEYLTIIATASLMPLEAYEFVHRHTLLRVLALLVNAAIVGYLIYRVRTHPK
jgi:uncharacterized membrane protein (DUF2068 family)